MSKVQERGLLEALGEADGLARVIRAMSDGRLDLVPVTMGSGLGTVQPLSFKAAKTEASRIAGTLPSSAAHAPRVANYDELMRLGDGTTMAEDQAAETFCSNCGCLDEPGVHSQPDCPRYDHAQPERPRDGGSPPAQRLHEWTSDPRQPNVPDDRAATSRPEPRST